MINLTFALTAGEQEGELEGQVGFWGDRTENEVFVGRFCVFLGLT